MKPVKNASTLAGKTVTLGVTGSIAAYKAVLVARLLIKAKARVRVVLTAGATRFVGASTFSGITGEPVFSDMFAADSGGERHVALAAESDLVLVVPATADALARFASGRADDLLTALVLCARCPVLAAPAMHPSMWSHPATERNVATLRTDGRVRLVGPVEGEVASGDIGLGRMVEPEALLDMAIQVVGISSGTSPNVGQDFRGKRVVVTAGPTVEDIDPVRFVSNRSSGKMGFAIAERAAARGAQVTLIAGPVTLATPAKVTRVDVRSAFDMQAALAHALGKTGEGADVLFMSAAVGDYRPEHTLPTKLKRGERRELVLRLAQNPDLLAQIGHARRGSRPLLVGFAVETGTDRQIVEYAREKLAKKKVDVVVANHAKESMGRDDNRVLVVDGAKMTTIGPAPKVEVADGLLDRMAVLLGTPGSAQRGSKTRKPKKRNVPAVRSRRERARR